MVLLYFSHLAKTRTTAKIFLLYRKKKTDVQGTRPFFLQKAQSGESIILNLNNFSFVKKNVV